MRLVMPPDGWRGWWPAKADGPPLRSTVRHGSRVASWNTWPIWSVVVSTRPELSGCRPEAIRSSVDLTARCAPGCCTAGSRLLVAEPIAEWLVAELAGRTTAMRVGRAIRSGTIWIDAYHHVSAEREIGGLGQSGLGRQQGVEGLLELTETRHLTLDHAPTLL